MCGDTGRPEDVAVVRLVGARSLGKCVVVGGGGGAWVVSAVCVRRSVGRASGHKPSHDKLVDFWY